MPHLHEPSDRQCPCECFKSEHYPSGILLARKEGAGEVLDRGKQGVVAGQLLEGEAGDGQEEKVAEMSGVKRGRGGGCKG